MTPRDQESAALLDGNGASIDIHVAFIPIDDALYAALARARFWAEEGRALIEADDDAKVVAVDASDLIEWTQSFTAMNRGTLGVGVEVFLRRLTSMAKDAANRRVSVYVVL